MNFGQITWKKDPATLAAQRKSGKDYVNHCWENLYNEINREDKRRATEFTKDRIKEND